MDNTLGWGALFAPPVTKDTQDRRKHPDAAAYLSNPSRYPQVTNAGDTRAFGLPRTTPYVAPRARRGQVSPVDRLFSRPDDVPQLDEPSTDANQEDTAPGVSVSSLAIRPRGMIEPGNIDLTSRPVVHNADGDISTVRSVSVTDDNGQATLIPTVIGNRVVSNSDAIAHYQKTGQHLGVFQNENDANAYAQQLHESQSQEYGAVSRATEHSAPTHGLEPPDATYMLDPTYVRHRGPIRAEAHYTTHPSGNGSVVRTSEPVFDPVPEAPESAHVPLPPTIGWGALFTGNDPQWIAAQQRARVRNRTEQADTQRPPLPNTAD